MKKFSHIVRRVRDRWPAASGRRLVSSFQFLVSSLNPAQKTLRLCAPARVSRNFRTLELPNFRTSGLLLFLCAGLAAHAQNPPFPQWFLDLGGLGEYPRWYLDEVACGDPQKLVDTVGDGIPDHWKRRTYAPVDVFGSHLDRDNDGLTDLEEFWFGSDPRTFSTRGDGWSDKEKRDNGLDACDKVTPTVTLGDWLAYAGWSGYEWQHATGLIDGFTGAYGNFILNTPPYSSGEGTLDFWLELRTDRHALLTVGDALTTNSFPVAAGTPRVRIRAALGAPVTLTMDPAPGTLADIPGATNGLWLCSMRIAPYRTNTVVFTENENPSPPPGEHAFVDGLLILEQPAGSIHRLDPEPTRGDPAPPVPTVKARHVNMGKVVNLLGMDGRDYYCLPCLGGWPTCSLLADEGTLAEGGKSGDDPVMLRDEAWDILTACVPPVEVVITQSVRHATYDAIYGTVIFRVAWCCKYWMSGAAGAEALLDHTPMSIGGYICPGIGCTCVTPVAVWIGFDHRKVKTRNLSRIFVGKPDEDTTEHCLGIVWKPDGKLDLFSLLDNNYLGYKDDLHFTSDNLTIANGELVFGGKPDDMKPSISLIKLRYKPDNDKVFDKLWITVNSPDTHASYTNWCAVNSTNMAWTLTLPPPFDSIAVANGIPTDPEPWKILGPNIWVTPTEEKTYLHHNAPFEMRSYPVTGDHGHQAMYDAQGILITETIAAGTADFVSTINQLGRRVPSLGHRRHDVYPFIRALQLDGNPCLPKSPSVPKTLNRPVLYQGSYTDKYIECRPPVPTGTRSRP